MSDNIENNNNAQAINWKSIIVQARNMFNANEQLNILIAGGTGVGKSTLINAVFGKEVAKTGQGKPITQQIDVYSHDRFCIYDTKGLELKDYADNLQNIKVFLEERQVKEMSKQIHIAWLCIAEPSRRVQESEKELYRILKKYRAYDCCHHKGYARQR